MQYCCRHIVSILLLIGYVGTGALLEFAHHDIHELLAQSPPIVSTHSCGAKEVHLPLDRKHECLACSLSTHRVATEALQGLADSSSPVYLGCISVLDEHFSTIDILYSGKRGPPRT